MHIDFIGTWSARLKRGKRNSSILINKNILVDCGPHTVEALLEMDVNPCDINPVLITHMHLDHFSGLIELIWHRSMSNCDPLLIIGPENIEDSIKKLLKLYYSPENFYNFKVLDKFNGIERFNGKHPAPDYGYRIEMDKTLFFSGDTSLSDEIINGAYKSDVLMHEATYPSGMENEAALHGHSTVSQAIEAFKRSGSAMLVPMHLSDLSLNEIKSRNLYIPEEYNSLEI
ncbi:MBL fold metallo-hydrolase [Picrophilus oshimae]|uniref:Metal dependent hydrolase n=1 Tax=Picrophilus torridus (strain ATCC 700027 / DSM 9790 / JCM 10055 / NBRC 100828 / KAW 2/3) TaxID=1122961 RepID=Q6L2E2_PICTO|nr:MBL fold metallo-hydrolase [Picrophilus oshimae]AAT42860.1 metal dependent hydrolase [Picrophilus oshimae DSM 9789]